MSLTESILLFWVLPSLLTFLYMAHLGRIEGEPIETWDGYTWGAIGIYTVIYVIPIILAFITNETLTKERKFKCHTSNTKEKHN